MFVAPPAHKTLAILADPIRSNRPSGLRMRGAFQQMQQLQQLSAAPPRNYVLFGHFKLDFDFSWYQYQANNRFCAEYLTVFHHRSHSRSRSRSLTCTR